jgi:hypothetical protein
MGGGKCIPFAMFLFCTISPDGQGRLAAGAHACDCSVLLMPAVPAAPPAPAVPQAADHHEPAAGPAAAPGQLPGQADAGRSCQLPFCAESVCLIGAEACAFYCFRQFRQEVSPLMYGLPPLLPTEPPYPLTPAIPLPSTPTHPTPASMVRSGSPSVHE